jgi:hypothetical protein
MSTSIVPPAHPASTSTEQPGWHLVDWDGQRAATAEEEQSYAGLVSVPDCPMVKMWFRLGPGMVTAPHSRPCWTAVSTLDRDVVTLFLRGNEIVPVRHRAGQTMVIEPNVVHAAVNPSSLAEVSVSEERTESVVGAGLVVRRNLAAWFEQAARRYQQHYVELGGSISVQDLLR